MKQGDLLQIVRESMALDEKANPDNDEVNAIIRKYLKRKGTPTDKEQAILDKYGITYDSDLKTFVGSNGQRLRWAGYEDGFTGDHGIIKPGTYISQNADNFEKADYANMLNKKHYNGDDWPYWDPIEGTFMRSSRNRNAYNTDKRSIYDLKRHIDAIKSDLNYFMQRYEEAVEEDDQHDIDFYAEKIDERQKRIDRLQQEIDYTMMFARQEHADKMSKTKNESFRSRKNRILKEGLFDRSNRVLLVTGPGEGTLKKFARLLNYPIYIHPASVEEHAQHLDDPNLRGDVILDDIDRYPPEVMSAVLQIIMNANKVLAICKDPNKLDQAIISRFYVKNLKESMSHKLKEEYSLVGQNGNAFSLMGYTARCMKECGISRDEIDKMYEEATSGDYDNLLIVCDDYIQRCNAIAEEEGLFECAEMNEEWTISEKELTNIIVDLLKKAEAEGLSDHEAAIEIADVFEKYYKD